jgi:hypothetical protein
MKINLVATVLGLGLTASLAPLLAHHSVAAQYDINKTITIQGVVTKTEWLNPHARVWVDAKNDDGTISNWEMELPPPNSLKRTEGVEKDFVKQGDRITVSLWRAKDGSRLASALTLTLPDGRILKLSQWMVANPIK